MERKLRIDSEDSTTASFHKPEQPENPNDARLPVYPMKSRTIPFPSFCPCSSDKEADHAAGRFFRPGPSMKKKPGKFFDKIEETVFIYFVHPNINDA